MALKPHSSGGIAVPAAFRKVRLPALPLALSLTLLVGCTSTPSREQIPQFRQGATTANQQTAQAFSDINVFLRQEQIERAITLPNLDERNFSQVLADGDIAKWNRAFSIIDTYAASLEKLLDPQRRSDVQDELVKLGNAIGAVDRNLLPNSNIAGGFATLGGLLLQAASEKDAMAAIRKADPGIQATFSTMREAIGADRNSAIRGTVFTTWQTKLGRFTPEFIGTRDKDARRELLQLYVATLDQRDAQDAALAALHRSLGLLGAAHTELAAGRNNGAQGLIDLIQREYATYRAQVKTIEEQRASAKNDQQGGTP